MLGRLIVGLLKGAFVGGAALAGLVLGIHWVTLPLVLAFALAIGLGALVGLVAGKPIWRQGAKVEAGLKSFVGALLGAAALWGLTSWHAAMSVLGSVQHLLPNQGVGDGVPVVVLPAIAMTIAMLFELDNTPEAEGSKKRVSALPEKRVRATAKAGAEDASAAEEEEAEVPRSRAKR